MSVGIDNVSLAVEVGYLDELQAQLLQHLSASALSRLFDICCACDSPWVRGVMSSFPSASTEASVWLAAVQAVHARARVVFGSARRLDNTSGKRGATEQRRISFPLSILNSTMDQVSDYSPMSVSSAVGVSAPSADERALRENENSPARSATFVNSLSNVAATPNTPLRILNSLNDGRRAVVGASGVDGVHAHRPTAAARALLGTPCRTAASTLPVDTTPPYVFPDVVEDHLRALRDHISDEVGPSVCFDEGERRFSVFENGRLVAARANSVCAAESVDTLRRNDTPTGVARSSAAAFVARGGVQPHQPRASVAARFGASSPRLSSCLASPANTTVRQSIVGCSSARPVPGSRATVVSESFVDVVQRAPLGARPPGATFVTSVARVATADAVRNAQHSSSGEQSSLPLTLSERFPDVEHTHRRVASAHISDVSSTGVAGQASPACSSALWSPSEAVAAGMLNGSLPSVRRLIDAELRSSRAAPLDSVQHAATADTAAQNVRRWPDDEPSSGAARQSRARFAAIGTSPGPTSSALSADAMVTQPLNCAANARFRRVRPHLPVSGSSCVDDVVVVPHESPSSGEDSCVQDAALLTGVRNVVSGAEQRIDQPVAGRLPSAASPSSGDGGGALHTSQHVAAAGASHARPTTDIWARRRAWRNSTSLTERFETAMAELRAEQALWGVPPREPEPPPPQPVVSSWPPSWLRDSAGDATKPTPRPRKAKAAARSTKGKGQAEPTPRPAKVKADATPPPAPATSPRTNLPRPAAARTSLPNRLRQHMDKWRRLTSNRALLRLVRNGLEFELQSKPRWTRRPPLFRGNDKQKKSLAATLERWLAAGVIEPDTSHNQLCSLLFPVPKKSGDDRWVLDLRLFNEHIIKRHFRLEGVNEVRQILRPNDWLASIDLSEAYLHVPVNRRHRRFLAFQANGQRYRFASMPFGASSAPRTFTELLKPVIAELHRLGIRATIYLDDLLLAAETSDDARWAAATARRLFDELGFTVNLEKSVLQPTQSIQHLGFVWDTVKWRLRLPPKKMAALRREARRVLKENDAGKLTARRLAGLAGKATAAAPAARALDYRRHSLHRNVNYALRANEGRWDATTRLSRTARRDVQWLASKALKYTQSCPITPPEPEATLITDASPSGWGGVLTLPNRRFETYGFFNHQESQRSSNWREAEAVRRVFFSFKNRLKSVDSLLVESDNTTTVSMLRRFGGRYRHLALAVDPVIRFCLRYGVHLLARHRPGVYNEEADALSRRPRDRNEWRLSNEAFTKISITFRHPTIDWFANADNTHCRRYASLRPDPHATYIDAMSVRWDQPQIFGRPFPLEFGLFVPPINLIGKVVQRLELLRPEGVVVVPEWPSKSWWPVLASISSEHILRLPDYAMEVPKGFPHPLRDRRAPPLVAFCLDPRRY
jgi:hypothetical protein